MFFLFYSCSTKSSKNNSKMLDPKFSYACKNVHSLSKGSLHLTGKSQLTGMGKHAFENAVEWFNAHPMFIDTWSTRIITMLVSNKWIVRWSVGILVTLMVHSSIITTAAPTSDVTGKPLNMSVWGTN